MAARQAGTRARGRIGLTRSPSHRSVTVGPILGSDAVALPSPSTDLSPSGHRDRVLVGSLPVTESELEQKDY